ncbi:hypothetical protein [Bifidobacterium castoris]|uniref:Uncharacterized protein n=1 Tax=Bifidobacterium castoris TaxID=2306972 RepID=A0A430FAI4_9BIFI|nr:hypothetical protein [Bifidobacterium castoris]RSX49818.1 hypothetical protein D2E22_0279 [Bifidobacterium castoris]
MKYFTSDLHLHHPFVAALRGYAKPQWPFLVSQKGLRVMKKLREVLNVGRKHD